MNASFISEQYNTYLTQAQQQESANQYHEAYKMYSALAADFEGIYNTEAVHNEAMRLQDTKPVQAKIKSEKKQAEQETALRKKFTRALTSVDLKHYHKKDRLKKQDWWNKEIDKLQQDTDKARTGEERWMFKRVFDYIWHFCAEHTMICLKENMLLKAAVYLEIWSIIQSDKPYPPYALARIFALDNKKEKALDALNTAIVNGFDDPEVLETEDAFETLRNTERFKQLLEHVRSSE